MWRAFIDAMAEWNSVAICGRLALAILTGTVIGIDRGLKRRGAGIKTHALVCLGSALVMLTSEYMSMNFDQKADLARLGAQVISGVGFLGVGTILVTEKQRVWGLPQQQDFGHVPVWGWRLESGLWKVQSIRWYSLLLYCAF